MKYITMPIEEFEELKEPINLKNRIEELTVENYKLQNELISLKENLDIERKNVEILKEECKLLRLGSEVFKEYEFIFKKGNFWKKFKLFFN